MEQNRPWKTQLIKKFHYRLHKCQPKESVLSQVKRVHIPFPISLRSNLTLHFHLCADLRTSIFSSSVLTRMYCEFFVSLIRTLWSTDLIFLFHQPFTVRCPVTILNHGAPWYVLVCRSPPCSFLRTNIILSIISLTHVFLRWKLEYHIKQRTKEDKLLIYNILYLPFNFEWVKYSRYWKPNLGATFFCWDFANKSACANVDR
jgi:hypothetical protein